MFHADYVGLCPDAELTSNHRSMGVLVHVPPETPMDSVVDFDAEIGSERIQRNIRVALSESATRHLSLDVMSRVAQWNEQDEEERRKAGRYHVFNSQRPSGAWDSFCITCTVMLCENAGYAESEKAEDEHLDAAHDGNRFVAAQ